MKIRFILFVVLALQFAGCSEIGVVREEVCKHKNEIKGAIDLLCSGTASRAQESVLLDSLNTWLGVKR